MHRLDSQQKEGKRRMRRVRGKDRQKVTDKTSHGENNYREVT